MFSDLQLPTGATASGHANCHSNADGGVPSGFSCMLSKPDHTCSPATCLEGGAWSAAVCVGSESAGCELSELAKPAGSQISVARCETGGMVPSGAVCEFSKTAHTCSGAVCVAGSWSTASCALSEPGCMFSDLEVPVGATVYGHENCDVFSAAMVPSGGVGCLLTKPGFACSGATCMTPPRM